MKNGISSNGNVWVARVTFVTASVLNLKFRVLALGELSSFGLISDLSLRIQARQVRYVCPIISKNVIKSRL